MRLYQLYLHQVGVNPESSTGALCLIHALTDFELMVSLCLSGHLLLHFKSVTIALQGVDVDIVTGYSMIKTIKDTLKNVSYDMI